MTASDRKAGDAPAMLTATFADRDTAMRAYHALGDQGFASDDISVVMSDETRRQHFGLATSDIGEEHGNEALQGSAKGAAIGGTAGIVIGLIAAAGAVAIPGIGLIVAGPLAAALTGLAAGSVAGGVAGALVGAGVPEERARTYETDVKGGNILLGVHPRSTEQAATIRAEWERAGAQRVIG